MFAEGFLKESNSFLSQRLEIFQEILKTKFKNTTEPC